ncbi:MAG: hypothetical protein ABWZ58_05555 [Acidimicrobiia bacterium]
MTVSLMASVCSRCRVAEECRALADELEGRGVEISGVWAAQLR